MASDKGLEFSVEIADSLPDSLGTDGKRLQQILANLLSNAFKFTAAGSVGLRIEPATEGWTPSHPILSAAAERAREDGVAAGVVALSVIDTGIGIPPAKQRLIFEAFQQADGTTSREYGGTGLGLSISRELARLLGGEIRVASEADAGSTFTLYLPLDYRPDVLEAASPQMSSSAESGEVYEPDVQRQQPPAASQGQEESALSGRKVLVVDDDIRNVFALASALEQHGLNVLHADSGKEGIEVLKRSRDIDVVLMDVMMPGLDGYDTIRLIRQLDGYDELPIIAVTAKAMLGDREKCIDAGATDYVAKPVEVDSLVRLLERSLVS
jgi:CheY-like chemotaxis protein